MLSKEHRANIEAAIKATEYKYFGMYGFTEAQHDAVDLLVSVAQAMLDDDEARRTVSADAERDAALTDGAIMRVAERFGFPLNANTANFARAILAAKEKK